MAITTTDLHHNFRADLGTTIVSDGLDEWADQQGEGSVTAPTATDRPVMDGTNLINGVDCPYFDGSSILALSTFSGGEISTTNTVVRFAVLKAPHGQTNGYLVDAGTTSDDRNSIRFNGSNVVVEAGGDTESAAFPDDEVFTLMVVFKYQLGDNFDGFEIYINGVRGNGTNTGDLTNFNGINIGDNRGQDGDHGEFTLAHIGAYAYGFNVDFDPTTLQGELETEWGLGTETTPPTVGDSGTLASDNVIHNSFDVLFTTGSDDTSANDDIVYYLYTALEGSLDTVENAEASGTLQNVGGTSGSQFTTFPAELSATNLSSSANYLYNIVQEDEAGNKTAYSQSSVYTKWGGNVSLNSNDIQSANISIFEVDGVALENINATGSFVETVVSDATGSWYMSSSYDATKQYFGAVLYFDVELSGSATSGSSNTLVDTSLSMSNDEYANKTIRITEGSGSGEEATIEGNTSDTFTINRNWDEVVVSGSVWQVGTLYSGPSLYLRRNE